MSADEIKAEPVRETEIEEVEELDDEDLDDPELEEDSIGDMFDPMAQLTQLLVTESGTPLVDVLQGIQDSLDKQNKILYKLVSVIESK